MILGRGQGEAAKTGALPARFDCHHAKVGKSAFLAGERGAGPDRIAIAKYQQALVGIGDDVAKRGKIGSLTVEQVSLMRPPLPRRIAAIGGLDECVDAGKIVDGRGLKVHRALLPQSKGMKKPAR
jgi:hypothetical protein